MDPWRDAAGPALYPEGLEHPQEVVIQSLRGRRVYECCCSQGEARRFGVGDTRKIRVVGPGGKVLYEGRWDQWERV